MKRYGVDVGNEAATYEAKYPLYSNGEHVGNKVRAPGKRFSFEGSVKDLALFGQQAFPPGSAKFITVVEGQDDAMAAYQMMGSKYPVVSVHSSSTAERDCRNNFEYLNSFDNIVFAFDNDEPGLKAAKAAAAVGFPLNKIKVLTTRKYKDANEYLINREADQYTREWWQAPPYRPDELKFGSDLLPEILDRKDAFSVPMPWDGLNEKRAELRLSEAIIITADTGVGKTSFIKHIEHKLLTDPTVIEKGYGVGFLHLEEPNGDTALGLLSVHNSQPYHLMRRDEWPVEEIKKAYTEVLDNNRVVVWDHFGSNTVDAVLNKVRHMVALGCRYIVLDHLSIVVSDQSGDERKQLDEIATKLKTLTMELDIALVAVIHTNRQGQIRGTAGVEQLANIVIRLERDKTESNEWRRNITKVSVEKNRFSGFTGPACYLWFNHHTARLIELDKTAAALYEQGGVLNADQLPF
ncbi:toprim domain-containing protein [Patescibacteria group bacterium]|nr:toprim domain-containing protein [Patescibacteria group bacterium]